MEIGFDRPTWPVGPSRPPAPSTEVHVWLAELDAPGWPGVEGLPSLERRRAAGFLRPGLATRWSASRWALRTILGRYLDERPAAIDLLASEHGKLRLAEEPGRLEFNLSHSGELALIAVCVGRQVGVDIEAINPGRDFLALAERSFEPDVVEAIRAAPAERRAGAFYAAWTRHEALAKCDGGGLAGRVRTQRMATALLDPGPGYTAALAVAAARMPPLDRWSIEPRHTRIRR